MENLIEKIVPRKTMSFFCRVHSVLFMSWTFKRIKYLRPCRVYDRMEVCDCVRTRWDGLCLYCEKWMDEWQELCPHTAQSGRATGYEGRVEAHETKINIHSYKMRIVKEWYEQMSERASRQSSQPAIEAVMKMLQLLFPNVIYQFAESEEE